MSNEEKKVEQKEVEPKGKAKVESTRIELSRTKEQNVTIKVLVNKVVTVEYNGENIILQPKSINKGYKRSGLKNINKNEILVMAGGL